MWIELVFRNTLVSSVSDHSYIVSTKHSDDLATTVKLDEEPLVEILSPGVRWYRHLSSESLDLLGYSRRIGEAIQTAEPIMVRTEDIPSSAQVGPVPC